MSQQPLSQPAPLARSKTLITLTTRRSSSPVPALPTDAQEGIPDWTTSELLVLSHAVLKCGENSWSSVARSVAKTLRSTGMTRRDPSFFSQQNCASAYSKQLDEAPKRKRPRKVAHPSMAADRSPSPTKPPMGHGLYSKDTPSVVIGEKYRTLRCAELRKSILEKELAGRAIYKDIHGINAGSCDSLLVDSFNVQVQRARAEQQRQEEIAARGAAAAAAELERQAAVAAVNSLATTTTTTTTTTTSTTTTPTPMSAAETTTTTPNTTATTTTPTTTTPATATAATTTTTTSTTPTTATTTPTASTPLPTLTLTTTTPTTPTTPTTATTTTTTTTPATTTATTPSTSSQHPVSTPPPLHTQNQPIKEERVSGPNPVLAVPPSIVATPSPPEDDDIVMSSETSSTEEPVTSSVADPSSSEMKTVSTSPSPTPSPSGQPRSPPSIPAAARTEPPASSVVPTHDNDTASSLSNPTSTTTETPSVAAPTGVTPETGPAVPSSPTAAPVLSPSKLFETTGSPPSWLTPKAAKPASPPPASSPPPREASRPVAPSPSPPAQSNDPPKADVTASLKRVVERVHSHKDAWPFDAPVTKEEAEDYHEIITDPTDLSTISKQIESGKIASSLQLYTQLVLMTNNARTYNNRGTAVYKTASRLAEFVRTTAMMDVNEVDPSWNDYVQPVLPDTPASSSATPARASRRSAQSTPVARTPATKRRRSNSDVNIETDEPAGLSSPTSSPPSKRRRSRRNG